MTDFDELAANAEAMLASEPRSIEPHWSDDTRFNSKAHYDRVMAGVESLNSHDATAEDLRKDAEFRADRQDTGNGLYEPQSILNIARDGRHGRGREL